nr:hypothetical protein [Tanacetum cinerariifolium]
MTAFWVVNNQFQKFIDSQFSLDYDSQMTDKYFVEYTRIKVKHFRDTLLQHMGNVKKSVAERTRHQRQYDKKVNKRQMQTQESKIDMGKAVDDDLVVTENIRPIYDEEPMAEVQLTNECNIFAIIQQHTEQPKLINEDEARKKTQERDRNSKASVMPFARFQSNADDSKPKPRSTNHSTRSFPVSKNSCVTITAVPKADHSKDFSSYSDSKHFVCFTCHKNRNKPVDQKSHIQKPGRQIFIRYRFSPNKTFDVYEKTSPRSDLRWKPTSRTFKTASFGWIPTGKLFNSCTSKADSESTHVSNVDIPNIHECKQTLNVSAGTSINVQKEQSLDLTAGTLCNVNKENLKVWLLRKLISQKPLSKWIHR